MIFHFDFENWLTLIRLASGEKQMAVRLYFLAILLIWVPIVSSFHAICFFLDGIFFPGLWRTRVEKPIFVVGHARSGTTLVHRLMSADGDRFSVFQLYEMYFPSLLQKKVIRAVAKFDRENFDGLLEKRVQAWEDKHYAAVRKVHKMGLTEAEEDDMVLYYSIASGFWITKMPYMGDIDFYDVDNWPTRKRRRMMRFYKDCVRRQLYLNGAEKTHLAKNPVFAGRVGALIETFPDCRIVTTMRNPYETIPSLLKLVQSGWKRLGWDDDRMNRCLRVLADQSFHTYLHPLEVLEASPKTTGAVVDYRLATTDAEAAIRQLYADLGLSVRDEYAKFLEAQGKRERSHRSGHEYSLDEFGLDADEIRTRLAPLFERFGWDDDATARAVPTEPRLAYLHIPKVAGTALTSAIERRLGEGSLATLRFDRSMFGGFDRFDQLAPAIRTAIGVDDAGLGTLREARFVAGHFWLSTLERFFSADCIFTMLREPRTRLLSQYEFWRAQTSEEIASWAPFDLPASALQPLADFLTDPRVASSTDNVVCRLVLGPDPRLPAEGFIDPADYSRLESEAIARMKRFRRVAIVEAEGPSFTSLGAALGLDLEVGLENVRRTPAWERPPLDGRLLELLEARTAVDARIYRAFANGVLAEGVAVREEAERIFRERWAPARSSV